MEAQDSPVAGEGPRSPDRGAVRIRTTAVRVWTVRRFSRASEWKWRPEPESNRRARICSPLRNHSAIGPRAKAFPEAGPRGQVPTSAQLPPARAFHQWRLARSRPPDMRRALRMRRRFGMLEL